MNDEAVLRGNSEAELRRTRRPDEPNSDYLWEKNILRCVGSWSVDMTVALYPVTPELTASFREAAIDFVNVGDYSLSVYQNCFAVIANSPRRSTSDVFDESWLAGASNVLSDDPERSWLTDV